MTQPQRPARGRVSLETIESAALAGNPLSDPSVREVPVYLPPGYDLDDRRYPSVYLLAGYTGCGRSFLNVTAFGETIPEKLDRLIAAGVMGPMIVVMPDGFTALGGSQYIDSAATGNYETHLVHELVGHMDRRFRTLAHRSHRGVVGKSSGGYGALVLGMRHPEVFGAVACHSGDCAFELCYLPDFAKVVTELQGRSLDSWLASFRAATTKSNQAIMVMNILAMAAAYSPNPSKPPIGADLPFDLHTAQVDDVVWQRWLANDPLRLASHHVEALRSLRLLYLDCGTRDEFHLHLGARRLAREFSRLVVPHHHEEFDAGHFNITHRYDVSMPRLWEALRP